MKKLILVMVACLALSACEKSPERKLLSNNSVGFLVDVDEIVTSWNDHDVRSKVETSEGVFTVYGVLSSVKGAAVTLRVYDEGSRFLCIEDIPNCPRVL
jgi:hypothetical protein